MTETRHRTPRAAWRLPALASLFAAGRAAAASETPPPPAPAFDVSSLVNLGIKLLVVIAVILALAWLARQVPTLRRSSGPITILGGLNVGNRERIVLVEVHGERVLLGVTPGSVTTLHVLDRLAVHGAGAGETDGEDSPRRRFDFRSALADYHRAREDGGGPPHP